MKTGISRLLVILAAMVALAAFAAIAFGHDPWRYEPSFNSPRTEVHLQLNPEQIEELERARKEYLEKAAPLERQLEAKWIELENLMSRPSGDVDQVMSLRLQVRELERDLEDLWFEADAEVGRGLSPEQRRRLGNAGDLLAGHGRWACIDGCSWHGRSTWSRSHDRWRDRWSDTRGRDHCW
jgi:Spy/CpxP family protein refolding chaperone